MSTPTFADTHNMVICYALTVNPTIYTSCIQHIWATAKAKMVNGEVLIACPTATILRMDGWLGDMSHHKQIYVNPSHTKKIFANMKRDGNDFSRRITPLFETMLVQPTQDEGVDSGELNSLKIRRVWVIKVAHDETEHKESVPTPSNDPLPSGEDSMQLNDLMVLCTKLQKQVLDLEKAKSDQAIEIASLKKRVDKLEKRRKFRTAGLQRLKKVGTTRRIKSTNDSLGAQEDVSKQGRSIRDIDADAEVTLVNETQERQDEDLMFDTGVLDSDEMFVDATTGEKDKQSTKIDDSTAGEAVTTAGVGDSVVPTIPTTVEETLAQTLMEIKAAKPKTKGIVFHDLKKQVSKPTVSVTQPSIKDKGKGIMQEPERPLTKKDQVALDEDLARNIQAQLDAEIIEEERLERQKQEEANIVLIESWENTQAIIEADRLLTEKLQTKEREELTDEEKGKLFMELIEKKRKHFAAIRAQEKRNIPPTNAQKRSQMSTYLKHMGGYKHKQLKGKSYDEIQKLFDKEMKRKVVRRKLNAAERRCLVRKEQQQESSKRQRMEDDKETDEHEEVEADGAELKKHLVIVKDDEIAIDAIPLATKPPVIVEYKLLKEGIMVHYQLIRADGSSKRYSSMIRMLQDIDREDLETLWKLVKTKHGDIRPEDEHERVLWGDLKVMFEPDIRSEVWRNLQGYTVTVWKLYDSCGVHFVRNLKIQKMNIKFRGGLLGLKRLQGFLELLLLRNRSRIRINKWYQSFALRNFDLEDMEFESTNSNTTAKLPILKLGEYEMWVIRIKQYFQIQDYALWEVIENGNSWVSVPQTAQENGTSVTKMSVPVTAEEKTNKKNDVKARSLLLMALPNEHQLTFSQYPDAKTMFAAIKTRFGGNEATKKTQKTLLKQQYENFSASSAESLDSIFNRLQKIVSRLAILGVVIAQEDLNSKFLSSLPPEWNTHVVVWMNKPEIETMSIDDFTNDANTASPQVSTASPNVNTASPQVSTASFSDNVVYAFMVENPNGSNLLHQYLEKIHEDDLEAMDLKWQLSLLSMRAKRYYQRTGKKIFINANDTAGYDKSKVRVFHQLSILDWDTLLRKCRARKKQGMSSSEIKDNTREGKETMKTTSLKAMFAIRW
ncbi:hypothetical protein Tco_1402528 [Tanacetum coccineum]